MANAFEVNFYHTATKKWAYYTPALTTTAMLTYEPKNKSWIMEENGKRIFSGREATSAFGEYSTAVKIIIVPDASLGVCDYYMQALKLAIGDAKTRERFEESVKDGYHFSFLFEGGTVSTYGDDYTAAKGITYKVPEDLQSNVGKSESEINKELASSGSNVNVSVTEPVISENWNKPNANQNSIISANPNATSDIYADPELEVITSPSKKRGIAIGIAAAGIGLAALIAKAKAS